jgi:uncharacterized delta-60 repeat protein
MLRRLPAALVAASLLLPLVTARAAAGDLDPTFGAGGLAYANFADGSEGFAGALTTDGMFVIAGHAGPTLALARFMPDGTLDPTFSGDGKLTLKIGEGSSQGNDVLVQTDGKIVVAAYGVSGGRAAFFIVRLNPDGTRDRTFGVAGVAVTSFAAGPATPWAVALQSGGQVLVTGSAGPDIAVARYTSAGVLDPTFSGDGWLTLSAGLESEDEGADIAVAPDGSVVVVASIDGNTGFLAARFDAGGNPDTTFRAAGYAIVRLGEEDTATSVVVRPNGQVVLGGYATPTGGVCCEMVLVAFGVHGGRLTNFGGGDGIAEGVPAVTGWGLLFSLVRTSDDGVIAVGTGGLTPVAQDLVVARFGPDGVPDPTFGGDGYVVVQKKGQESGYGVALTSTGGIAVAGARYGVSGFRFMAARFLAA